MGCFFPILPSSVSIFSLTLAPAPASPALLGAALPFALQISVQPLNIQWMNVWQVNSHILFMLRILNLLLAAILFFPSETQAEDSNSAPGPHFGFKHHLRPHNSDNRSVKTTDSNNSVLKKRGV